MKLHVNIRHEQLNANCRQPDVRQAAQGRRLAAPGALAGGAERPPCAGGGRGGARAQGQGRQDGGEGGIRARRRRRVSCQISETDICICRFSQGRQGGNSVSVHHGGGKPFGTTSIIMCVSIGDSSKGQAAGMREDAASERGGSGECLTILSFCIPEICEQPGARRWEAAAAAVGALPT